MKSIYTLILLMFLFLISCEKEIEIDTRANPNVPVIDAVFSNRPGDARVILTRTQDLSVPQEPEPIENAEVSILNHSTGVVHVLPQLTPGYYADAELFGEPGQMYSLQVQLANGELFTATDTMPFPVEMQRLDYQLAGESFQTDDETFIEVLPVFTDPAEYVNFYQVAILQNGEQPDIVATIRDLGFNGVPNSQYSYLEVEEGDLLEVDLQSITEPVYDYLEGLNLNLLQVTATPTNPDSNLSNGALGYFKVFSAGEKIQTTIQLE